MAILLSLGGTGSARRLRTALAALGTAVLGAVAGAAAGQAPEFITADHFRSGSIRGLGIGPARQEPDEYFQALAATGANVGRVFFNFTRCKTCAEYEISAGELYNLDSMLESARRHRLALILVATFAEDERGAWWTDERLWRPAGLAWESLARRYNGESAVAAYELFNEPIARGMSLGDALARWSRMTGEMIRTVRAVDGVHPIIVQPPQGGSGAGFAQLRPFADAGIVYSFHYYIPHQITHQGVSPEWQRRIPYPAGAEYGLGTWDPRDGAVAWNKVRMSQTLDPVREFVRRHRVPVFVGELGCVRWAPDGSAYRYVRDVLDLIRAEGWSWAYHEFRAWPGWDPEIASDDPAERKRDPNAPMMRLLKEALAPRSGKSQ